MRLTDVALTSIKNHIIEKIAYAGYEEPNGNVTKMDISEVVTADDGTLRFLLKANFSSSVMIFMLHLYDSEGKSWLSQNCDIRIDVTESTEVTFLFDFKVEEEL